MNKFSVTRFPFLTALLMSVATLFVAFQAVANSDYQTLTWEDLVPDFPELEQLRAGADFSAAELNKVYEKIWDPNNVVTSLAEQDVRISGFIVPLEFSDDQLITQFFLVPYHGACIHSPAPPPNQLIMAHYPEGLILESLDTPYWVSGEMSIEIDGNDLGTSGYSLQMHEFEIYEY